MRIARFRKNNSKEAEGIQPPCCCWRYYIPDIQKSQAIHDILSSISVFTTKNHNVRWKFSAFLRELSFKFNLLPVLHRQREHDTHSELSTQNPKTAVIGDIAPLPMPAPDESRGSFPALPFSPPSFLSPATGRKLIPLWTRHSTDLISSERKSAGQKGSLPVQRSYVHWFRCFVSPCETRCAARNLPS